VKKVVILIILSLSTISFFAQKETKIYYDTNWDVCKKRNASFYRIVTLDENNTPIGLVRDYYKDSDKLQYEGQMSSVRISNDTYDVSDGHGTWYYDNGNPERKSNYLNGAIDGDSFKYYYNGNLKNITNYTLGQPSDIGYIVCEEDGVCSKYIHETFRFDGNVNDWPLMSNEKYSTEIIKDKGLKMNIISGTGLGQFIETPINYKKDFTLETIVSFNSGEENNGQGLLWGFENWENYYYFVISANGQFRIVREIDGVTDEFSPWTVSKHINQHINSNHLKILNINNTVYYFINQNLVAQHGIFSHEIAGKTAGFYSASGKKEIIFQYLFGAQIGDSFADREISKENIYYARALKSYDSENYDISLSYLWTLQNIIEGSNGKIESLKAKNYYLKGDITTANQTFQVFLDTYKDSSSEKLVRNTVQFFKYQEEKRCTCNTCNGSGKLATNKKGPEEIVSEKCTTCDGAGGGSWSYNYTVIVNKDGSPASSNTSWTCSSCGGSGVMSYVQNATIYENCYYCGGDGDICK